MTITVRTREGGGMRSTTRKLLGLSTTLGFVALTVAISATPAAADPGQTQHFSFSGLSAAASWTTCPPPPAEVQCTITNISASDGGRATQGGPPPVPTLFF